MAKQINEETKVILDLKTIGLVLVGVATIIGMWFVSSSRYRKSKRTYQFPL